MKKELYLNDEQLLVELGYLSSQFKYKSINSQENFFYLDTLRSYRKIILGTYYYSTSQNDALTLPRIAIQFSIAKDKAEAKEIHRKVWNMGNTPVLIIQLPNEILIYNGFDYNADKESKLIEDTIDNTLIGVRDKLKALYSENIDSGQIWSDISEKMNLSQKIDTHLLKNLASLGEIVKGKIKFLVKNAKDKDELSAHLSNSIIGKYLYIKYLRDRNIISDRWLEDNQIKQEKI